MYSVGASLLSLLWLEGGPVHAAAQDTNGPDAGHAFPIRECYCPAHFGNSYEAMGPREMAAYLAEMKWMGFNRFGDWMTTTDVCNPYTSEATWDLAKELLDRKKKTFRAAQDLGFRLNLIVTPNHVYLDHLDARYAAQKGPRIQGQLICPSEPEARKIILRNFERWFATQERLYREVYRLGPVRHVLNPRFMPPPWYESWRQVNTDEPKGGTILPQQ